jgi:AAA domain-containing protein/DnaB helicase-like protein
VITDSGTPPHDEHAEFALLATLIHGDPALSVKVWAECKPSDFYVQRHAHLAGLIAGMEHVDPTLVVDAVRARGEAQQRDGMLRLMPALVTWERLDIHAELYARTIAACSRRRQLQNLAIRLHQQASNDTVDIDEVTVGALVAAEGLLEGRHREIQPPVNVDEFLAFQVGYDWLIPDLIERGDRFLITGAEGGGKSTWLRQIAVCAAAGINPVTFERCDPIRTLIVDLENGRPHLQRQLVPLVALARRVGDLDPSRLMIESKPAGIDLAEFEDAAWLADKVTAAKPDLIVVGPLYRMHALALDKEDAARAITVILDGLRQNHRCAVMVEAHAGHGHAGVRSWRPTGSSLFMRWPEFGYGLRPNSMTGEADVVAWRGPRDERKWPRKLRRGTAGSWPWIEMDADAPASVGWAS